MKKTLKRLAMLSVAMLLAFAGCEKEPEKDLDDDTGSGLPEVLTNEVSTITANSAVCGGYVTSDGGSAVTARGVCWSTQPNPMVNNSITTNGKGTGSFTANIAGLSPNQTYYVRAYATNSKGTVYGMQKTFTTTTTGGGGGGGGAITGTINGHDWVDLGLPSGLKWATCNVGASQPHGYGNYYAWGETTTKTSYDESNSVTDGQQINDFSGNATYDAARANWSSTWRMPTKAEMEEMVDNCTWTWTSQSGVKGYKVTGPNGNSIFLPAAAGYVGSSLGDDVGKLGLYWSSTPYESDTYNAYVLIIGYHNYVHRFDRHHGFTVRPVSD